MRDLHANQTPDPREADSTAKGRSGSALGLRTGLILGCERLMPREIWSLRFLANPTMLRGEPSPASDGQRGQLKLLFFPSWSESPADRPLRSEIGRGASGRARPRGPAQRVRPSKRAWSGRGPRFLAAFSGTAKAGRRDPVGGCEGLSWPPQPDRQGAGAILAPRAEWCEMALAYRIGTVSSRCIGRATGRGTGPAQPLPIMEEK
jgi:hypothetical protein